MYGDVFGGTAAGGAAAAAASGSLPFTGYGVTIPLLGVTLTLSWVLAIALVAIATGILLLRWEARRGTDAGLR